MQFQAAQYQTSSIKKKVKHEIVTFLKRALFLLAEIKAQWDESDGRILLGDNTGDGAVTLRPVRFLCAGAWISTGLLFV